MTDRISAIGSGPDIPNYKSEASKTTGFEQALNAAAEEMDNEKIMEAAREFEGYFLQMMFKEMRNSVPTDGLIPKSNAEEIFQSMLDEEYSKNAAKGKGMGLAQMIYEQLTRKNQVPPYAVSQAQLDTVTPADSEAENTQDMVEIPEISGMSDRFESSLDTNTNPD